MASLDGKTVKEVELIVSGDVQSVGFRQYAAKVARKLKLAGFAENIKDGTVLIHCKGNDEAISQFKKLINMKNPEAAPLIDVEDIKETQLAQGTIKQTTFEEKYSDSVAEMAQGFSTGIKYLNRLDANTQASFKQLDANTQSSFNRLDANTQASFKQLDANTQSSFNRLDANTQASFKHMDEKYDKISQGMFSVVGAMEKRMEKTDKNIEALLKVLVEKKG
ncbi:MAG: acylphosphatase [Nanoarchaeota archaeon]